MNRLELKNIPLYNYWNGEYLCYAAQPVIDGTVLGDHINTAFKECDSENLDYDCKLLALTFSPGLESKYCDRFMKWLLTEKSDAVIPILLCDGDTDFTCLVITAKVRTENYSIFWDEIGIVKNSFDFQDPQFGILHTDSYSDEDWEKYSDIAFESPDSPILKSWYLHNYQEEMFRRLKNGYFPFLQNSENIKVICRPKWQFDRTAYKKMLSFYSYANAIDAYEDMLPKL